jgi:predicted Zn-dependent protease
MMSNEIGMNILFTAAMSRTSSQGVQTVADLTRQILALSYSREDEKTADLGGLDYMVSAGYNPYGMVETMQMLEKEQEIRPVEFFSTHPSPENRISYISARIQAHHFNNVAGTSTLRSGSGLAAAAEDGKVGQEDYQQFVLDKIKN